MSSLTKDFGELMIDNRASGEPIPGMRQTFFEGATLGCVHCGGVVVLNPERIRPREYCKKCNKYICDGCFEVSKLPNYSHRTIDDLTEMVQSGNYHIVGGSVCNPTIIRG